MARKTYRERYMRIYKNLQQELQKPIYSGTTKITVPKKIGRKQLEALKQVSKELRQIGKRVTGLKKQGFIFEEAPIQLPKTLNKRTLSGLKERTRYTDLYRQAIINPKRDEIITEDVEEYDWYADNEFGEEQGTEFTPEADDMSMASLRAFLSMIENFTPSAVQYQTPDNITKKYTQVDSLKSEIDNILETYDNQKIAENVERNLSTIAKATDRIMYLCYEDGKPYDPTSDYNLVISILTQ